MPDTPLNPNALEVALRSVCSHMFAGELAEKLSDNVREGMRQHFATVVSAYLAAALPEVTSVEELDQLPDNTVALDDAGAVLRKWTANEWYATGDDQSYMNTEIGLPARVLHVPEVKP